MNFLFNYMAV